MVFGWSWCRMVSFRGHKSPVIRKRADGRDPAVDLIGHVVPPLPPLDLESRLFEVSAMKPVVLTVDESEAQRGLQENVTVGKPSVVRKVGAKQAL
jgi:hypothetical protein